MNYWIRFKQKFALLKPFRWVFISSIVLVLSLASSRSLAQSASSRGGIYFQGSRELNKATFVTSRYTGECPGTATPVVEAWFTSTTPSADRRRAVIRNITTGMDPDDLPYTDREYEKGKLSESFNVEFGTEHSGRRFRVMAGENQFEYDIKERGDVIASGSFMANITNTVRSYNRDSTLQSQKVCANSNVALSNCADVRTSNQWKCPNGDVVRRELTPEGAIRTVISNQTYEAISYEFNGRIYRLESGEDQTFTGNMLGNVEFFNSSGTSSSVSLVPGTRYRFVQSNNQLQLSVWQR